MENTICIDFQGFKTNRNEFIIKEVAVVFNAKEHINFIIKPPFDFQYLTPEKQKEANWLTNNYHHLKWNDGSVSFRSIIKFLRANVRHSNIYVKGKEKKKWLEKIIEQKVINIEEIGCINFKQLQIKYPECIYCSYHNYGVCALRNALLIAKEKFCLN